MSKINKETVVSAQLVNTTSNMNDDWETNGVDHVELIVYGKNGVVLESHSYTAAEDEPEDMKFGRTLEDCYSIKKMVELAHQLGVAGITITKVDVEM